MAAPSPARSAAEPRRRLVDVPPARVINPAFAVVDGLWILSGSDEPWIFDYNRALTRYADDGRLQGATGPTGTGQAVTGREPSRRVDHTGSARAGAGTLVRPPQLRNTGRGDPVDRHAPAVVLGLCAHTHDSSAALIVDGELVGFCEEERLLGDKHTKAFPARSVAWLLDDAELHPDDVTAVGYGPLPVPAAAGSCQAGRRLPGVAISLPVPRAPGCHQRWMRFIRGSSG